MEDTCGIHEGYIMRYMCLNCIQMMRRDHRDGARLRRPEADVRREDELRREVDKGGGSAARATAAATAAAAAAAAATHGAYGGTSSLWCRRPPRRLGRMPKAKLSSSSRSGRLWSLSSAKGVLSWSRRPNELNFIHRHRA